MNDEDIVIASVYIKNSIKKIDRRDLAVIMRLGNKVIVAGDFNARNEYWSCVSNNSRGKSLQEYLARQNGRILLHHTESPITRLIILAVLVILIYA